MRKAILLLMLAFTSGVSGPARADSVYDALGGGPAVERIVDRMLDTAHDDPRIANKLDNINLDRLKIRITAHVCELAGGPCHFEGIGMAGAHAYLQLTQFHFNALVEDLQAALDAENIPFRIQNRLLGLLAPLERQIVTR